RDRPSPNWTRRRRASSKADSAWLPVPKRMAKSSWSLRASAPSRCSRSRGRKASGNSRMVRRRLVAGKSVSSFTLPLRGSPGPPGQLRLDRPELLRQAGQGQPHDTEEAALNPADKGGRLLLDAVRARLVHGRPRGNVRLDLPVIQGAEPD